MKLNKSILKPLIYISGILGGLLLLFRVLGIFVEFPYNNVLLITGSALILLVFVPLMIIERTLHNRQIDKIIDSHKEQSAATIKESDKKSTLKGWGMNDSPYRERKSGLRWEGGNIKASGAKRGTRRKFLK